MSDKSRGFSLADAGKKAWELAKQDKLLSIVSTLFIGVVTNWLAFRSDELFEGVKLLAMVLILVSFSSAIKHIGLAFSEVYSEHLARTDDRKEKEVWDLSEYRNGILYKQKLEAHFQMEAIQKMVASGQTFVESTIEGSQIVIEASGEDGSILESYAKMYRKSIESLKNSVNEMYLPYKKWVDDRTKEIKNIVIEEKEPQLDDLPGLNEIDTKVVSMNPTSEELKHKTIDP